MLTTLTNIESNEAAQALSRLMRTLLPDASSQTQTQLLDTLTPVEHDMLREVRERLGFTGEIPTSIEVPAMLEFLSREVSNVVLGNANFTDLKARTSKAISAYRRSEEKPRVLIESSNKGRQIAETLSQSIEFEAETELWIENPPEISPSGIENLIRRVGTFDFAIFVTTIDDSYAVRGSAHSNLAFEAGLFLGKLGPNRIFFLVPESQLRLDFLSDLSGVLTVTYDPFEVELRRASRQILVGIQQFGPVGLERA